MKNKSFGTLIISFLVGCGGGSPTATFSPSAVPLTPQISVQNINFDLSQTVISGSRGDGGLFSCSDGGSEIHLSQYFPQLTTNNVTTSGSQTFWVNLYGNFTIAGGAFNCNTSGITGTINRQTYFDSKSNIIFDISNLNLPANAMQFGWRAYWAAILAQSGQITLTQSSVATLTCTNTASNKQFTLKPTSSGDMSGFIKNCVN